MGINAHVDRSKQEFLLTESWLLDRRLWQANIKSGHRHPLQLTAVATTMSPCPTKLFSLCNYSIQPGALKRSAL
jgi:hypothetical protein